MSNVAYTYPWSDTHVLEREAGVYVPSHFVQGRSVMNETGSEEGMLLEDIRLALQYSTGVDGAAIKYELQTPDPAVEQRVREALKSPHSYARSLDEVVEDVLVDLWSDALQAGIAILEVARLLPKTEDGLGPQDGVVVLRVPPGAVAKSRGRFVQHTSEADRLRLGIGREVRLIPPRFHVLELSDPINIDSVISGLRGTDLAGSVGVALYLDHPDLYRAGYRFEDHVAVRDAIVARSTARVGWSGRGHFDNSITTHYLFRRFVRFRRFIARLRKEILTYLNGVLGSANSYLGGDPTLVATNVPTDQAFDDADQALITGEKTFQDILSAIGG